MDSKPLGPADVAGVARLIGEPARAAMLDALLAGRALAAGELGRVGGVCPATASEHLARLRDGGLVEVVAAGRHRYYRLAGPDVAHALEALAMISPRKPVRSLRQSRAAAALAVARTCYDHLAGQLGVALHDALVSGEALAAGGDGYRLTDSGTALLSRLGVDVAGAAAARRAFARPCLDFTERRPHLAGALGAALCARLLADSWLVRPAAAGGCGNRANQHQRGLRLTGRGRANLETHFGVRLAANGTSTGATPAGR